ncbi:MAG: hypothetical protein SFW09_05465 [Hyphomicrobiaceae bacterium]|nr:hypothetical protein [Hyphomicrobiaceae bacterium]
MKFAAAAIVALSLLSGVAQARPVDGIFTDIERTAPRSVFDDLNSSAPRSLFDDIKDTSPRSAFGSLGDTAPLTDGATPRDLVGE